MLMMWMMLIVLTIFPNFSPTAECYGVSAQYRFRGGPRRAGAVWGSSGFWVPEYRIVLKPGSEGSEGSETSALRLLAAWAFVT